MTMIIHMFRLLGLGARKVSTITSWSKAINNSGMRPVCMMLDLKRGFGLFHDRLPPQSISKQRYISVFVECAEGVACLFTAQCGWTAAFQVNVV